MRKKTAKKKIRNENQRGKYTSLDKDQERETNYKERK